METSLSFNLENRKKELFRMAMRGEWEEVVRIYGEDRTTHEVRITRTADTALHVAASDGQEEVVEKLVEIVSTLSPQHAEQVLRTKNEMGNTPLHIAASLGNVRTCGCIARVSSSLIGAQNNEGETPFFLTAIRGKKEAFLCLHAICGPDRGSNYCRRIDGETILHRAISGDYFDLAFQIIHLYPSLVNSVNEHGFTPLHILAAKPSAFKSGSNLGRWNTIIYHCILVDDLKKEHLYDWESLVKRSKEEKNSNFPENYKCCINILKLLRKAFRIAKNQQLGGGFYVFFNEDPKQSKRDAENPEGLGVVLNGNKKGTGQNSTPTFERRHMYPANYTTCFAFFNVIYKSLLIVLGLGSNAINRIREKKEKHKWSVQVMNNLLQSTSTYEYDYTGQAPQNTHNDDQETLPYEISKLFDDQPKPNNTTSSKEGGRSEIEKETAMLIAAKNGVTEMVEKILELFPVAIHDVNAEKKNIVLLAVENRQPHVYKLLLKRNILRDSVFRKLDHNGNSALHLAATLGGYKPWLIPGAALQMQWEIKWYEFVKNSMQPHFFVRYNDERKTPRDVFTETHEELVKAGGEWLTNTSESCSVVAALIATVAFATSTAVPGGTKEETGRPTLEHETAFEIFAIASLVALCFSVTSVVMFLAILTSRYQEMDFGKDLPKKLLVGLTSLFVSIAAILISFCAGHFFVLKDELQYAAFPIYAVTCLPVSFFAVAQFPLYFDLLLATYAKVPQRSYKLSSL